MSKHTGLGFLECVMMLVGGMIGSAIFSLSGLTLFLAGPAALLSWLIGAVIMFFYGMYMAELACRYPQSGGIYVFPHLAFGGSLGRSLGWFAAWGAILTNIIAVAFGGIYVGQYLSVAFPGAANLQRPLALAAILLCCGMDVISLKITGKINAAIVLALLATLLIYVGTAFFGGNYETSMLTPFFSQGVSGKAGFLAAVPTAIIGYSSVVAMAFMAGNVRNLQRNLPLSILVAMCLVAGIYLAVILATAGLVSAQYLVDNPGMRFIPLFAACFTKLKAMPWLASVVSISAVLALMTTILVCISMNSRAVQAVAKDGILPGFLAKSNSSGVPAYASLASTLPALACACFPDFTDKLVNFGAIFNVITMLISMFALLKARQDKSQAKLFHTPGGRILPYVILLLLCLVNFTSILQGGWGLWLYTLAFLILGALLLKRKF